MPFFFRLEGSSFSGASFNTAPGASFDTSLRTSLGARRTSPNAQRHIGSLVDDAARRDPFVLLEPDQRLPRLGPQHAVHRTVVVALFDQHLLDAADVYVARTNSRPAACLERRGGRSKRNHGHDP